MTHPEVPALPVTESDIAALSPADLAARLQQGLDTQSTGTQSIGTLGNKLGIVLTEAGRERMVGMMPTAGNLQPAGRLHGGASAALAEELASMGSWLNLDMGKQIAVGVDLNITHVRGAVGGDVRGVAELLYRGRTVMVWGIQIYSEHGKLISTGRCTCNVVNL
jgi:1,4-dihydroxy-2-naphthoyl-CoA hydrolase